MKLYILVDRKAVECKDRKKWLSRLYKHDRVGLTVGSKSTVSTLFLGIDHSFGRGSPKLFETLVCGGLHDMFLQRYSTWEEAEAGHAKVCQLVFGKDWERK